MDCIAGFDAVDIFIFGWILFSFVWPVIAKVMKGKDSEADVPAGSLSAEELEELFPIVEHVELSMIEEEDLESILVYSHSNNKATIKKYHPLFHKIWQVFFLSGKP